jgi:hypothetical protein
MKIGLRAVPAVRNPKRIPSQLREAYASVPGMGRILLDERSQPEPMTVTVANRKA